MTAPLDKYASRVLADFVAQRKLERAIAADGRRRMARGFDGALGGRLAGFLPTGSASLNADLESALVPLRSRARHLCANTSAGRRFLTLARNNIVGPQGPMLQVRALTQSGTLDKVANDAIELAWSRWCRPANADVRGLMSFAQILRVAVAATARDGEALIRKVRNRNYLGGLRLQLLEADRLDECANGTLQGGNVVRMGVELDTMSRPVAYHVKAAHPGDNRGLNPGTERVPAADLVHLFVPERAEQVRAHTWLHAVIVDAGMLNRFGNSALVAAEVGASKMGVFTRKEDADPNALKALGDTESDGALQMSAEAGEFIELPTGYSLESWDPQYPNEVFDSFVNTFMRRIAAGLDVAEHNLSGNMSGVNYSSARIAELAERDVWLTLQQWLIDACVMPLYAEWLQWSLLRGDVRLPASGKALPFDKLDKFLDASFFRGRRWKWVDPAKEIAAARDAVDARLASRTQIAAEQGVELDDVIAELATEQQMLAAAGLLPAARPAAAPAATPDPEEAPAS